MDTSNSDNLDDSVAIIGLAGRFPGGNETPDQLWESIKLGTNCISYFSPDELHRQGVPRESLSKLGYVCAAPILRDVEFFDAAFFGITPAEAELMDPQHRFLLECCWTALENAGYAPTGLTTETGVFVGARTDTYLLNLLQHGDLLESVGSFNLGLGNDLGFLATRISHSLDLSGPSYSIQTACSTSLVSVHLACQSLLLGECHLALAGGVAINVPQITGYQYQEGSVLSPDGYCRPFDAKARGTIFGSGVGVIVLKRLEDALAAGDCVRAIILGSAVNNDGGKKASFTAPGIQGQVKLLRTALSNAGVTPDSISYIEAHGTGTLLGDAIELRALAKAFGLKQGQACAIGSIKGNLGHLDAAAGITGLIKVVLSLQHRQLVPSLHFERANPQIDLQGNGFHINTQLQEWSSDGRPRRAGVSAFGVGGTNAHVVLQEAPTLEASGEGRRLQLLACSGMTEKAESEVAQQLAASLRDQTGIQLADVAYTLAVGRQRCSLRRAIVCGTQQEAIEALESNTCAAKNDGEQDVIGVGFLFPGQGTQVLGMGHQLYSTEDTFRLEMDHCAELVHKQIGFDLRKVIYQGTEKEIWQTRLAQPVLFATEYALARLWMSWGVHPRAMLGHSMGEYVAACLAGVMELRDALALVSIRGLLMERMTEGAMAAVEAEERELDAWLGDDLCIAAVNGPRLCTVSGAPAKIEKLCDTWHKQSKMARRLRTSRGFHSRLMDPMVDEFVSEVAKVDLKPPQIRCISNVTGNWIEGEYRDPKYWGEQLRRPVRFADGVNKLLDQNALALLEVGPGQQLIRMVRTSHPQAVLFNSLGGATEQRSVLEALGGLWCAGVDVSWKGFFEAQRRHRVPLPSYPFQRKRYWVSPHPDNSRFPRKPESAANNLNQGKLDDVDQWFWSPSWQLAARNEGSASIDQRWIVFEDEYGISSEFLAFVRDGGASAVSVRTGDRFSEISANSFVINPMSAGDYSELCRRLKYNEFKPSHVFHAWGLTEPGLAQESRQFYEDFQPKGNYSLTHFASECVDQGWSCRFLIMSNDCLRIESYDVAVAAKSAPIAFCKILPQENPHLAAVFVDIRISDKAGLQKWLWESLLGDVDAQSSSPVVAYRGRQRWVQRFQQRELVRSERGFRRGGIYIITGGYGSIGMLIGEHLMSQYQARIVLTGRSPSEEVLSRIATLQSRVDPGAANGGEVHGDILLCSADVGDEASMQKALSLCCKKFGSPHGIIHAAGITHGPSLFKLIKDTEIENCNTQAYPKLCGLYVIEKLSREVNLDFVLAMSSNASVLGGIGFLSYATANCAMDIFVSRAELSESNTRWISANWDHWPEDTRKYTHAKTSMSEYTMTITEALDAFERVASSQESGQVIVSTGHFPTRHNFWIDSTYRGAMEGTSKGSLPTRSARPAIQSVYLEPRNSLEAAIALVWAEVLGLEKVGVNDDFFELGGHSLLATGLMSKISTVANSSVPLKALFEGPTVAELAASISTEHAVVYSDH